MEPIALTRAEQRERTRDRIVAAAVATFAQHGFDAASTRAIAAEAGVTQGLLTYHFSSKDALWRAAADEIFSDLTAATGRLDSPSPDRETLADGLRRYVYFSASRPAIVNFMVDAGRQSDERMQWLVDTHLASKFDTIAEFAKLSFPDLGAKAVPHIFYALVGAASLMFAVRHECIALTGTDPAQATAIKRHADLVVRLFLPS